MKYDAEFFLEIEGSYENMWETQNKTSLKIFNHNILSIIELFS